MATPTNPAPRNVSGAGPRYRPRKRTVFSLSRWNVMASMSRNRHPNVRNPMSLLRPGGGIELASSS